MSEFCPRPFPHRLCCVGVLAVGHPDKTFSGGGNLLGTALVSGWLSKQLPKNHHYNHGQNRAIKNSKRQ